MFAAMRVGVIQMCSVDDVDRNLEAAAASVAEAVGGGATWVTLPEMFGYLRREGQTFPCAASLEASPILAAARGWARQHGIWILAGSIPEARDDGRVFNTSVMISPTGADTAVYRKIHLFDVDLSDQGGQAYAESMSIAPGDEVVVADTPFGGVGLSICYDLRFPELYRAQLADERVRFLVVPSAFAPETGRAHWETLLRARAIENQCFVLAPAQCGQHTPDRASYGHAMAIDPWGQVIAQAADQPCVLLADCDLDAQERTRDRLPVLSHRRL